MGKRLLLICYDFGKQMGKKNISALAAGTAFFLFLSLIPILMLLCALIPYTPLTEASLMNAAVLLFPDSMEPVMIGIIADVYDKSFGIISITIIGTLWSAGKGVLALIRGLNSINNVEENRNYFVLRLAASLYTVLLLIAILLSLLIMVFGNVLINMTEKVIPQSMYLVDVLLHFRTPALWAIMTIILAFIYAYISGKKMKFKAQLPGAAFAAVGWSALTFAFSIYIDRFNGFNTYGNLTTIIILLLWLYGGMYLILIGAYLNRYFKPIIQRRQKRHERKNEGKKG